MTAGIPTRCSGTIPFCYYVRCCSRFTLPAAKPIIPPRIDFLDIFSQLDIASVGIGRGRVLNNMAPPMNPDAKRLRVSVECDMDARGFKSADLVFSGIDDHHFVPNPRRHFCNLVSKRQVAS